MSSALLPLFGFFQGTLDIHGRFARALVVLVEGGGARERVVGIQRVTLLLEGGSGVYLG